MACPTTDNYIDQFEARTGFTLPVPYREHLKLSNGGSIDQGAIVWECYPVRDSSDKKRLKRTAVDMWEETKTARKWTGFPPEALAFAEDGTGNYAVFLPGSEEVHFWDHETGELSSLGNITLWLQSAH